MCETCDEFFLKNRSAYFILNISSKKLRLKAAPKEKGGM